MHIMQAVRVNLDAHYTSSQIGPDVNISVLTCSCQNNKLQRFYEYYAVKAISLTSQTSYN
jgi:hypothetical protein